MAKIRFLRRFAANAYKNPETTIIVISGFYNLVTRTGIEPMIPP